MSMLERLIYRLTGRVLLDKQDPRDPRCANCGTDVALRGPQWQREILGPGVIRVRRDLPCRGCAQGDHCQLIECPCIGCLYAERRFQSDKGMPA